jgi:hypothetical protein
MRGKRHTEARVIGKTGEHRVYIICLWFFLGLLVLLASSACAGGAQSSENLDPESGVLGESQDAPPTLSAKVITVDLVNLELGPLDRSSVSCPALRSPLLQVVESGDPVQGAQSLGLNVRGSAVQVVLVLDGGDTDFLKSFGVEVGKQAGGQIQAYVPISHLCKLSADKRVLAIYPAQQAEGQ